MKRMCIAPLYCKPRTSIRHPQHKIYPYLLRNKTVTHANQVWAMDITYVRMHKGWLYLCAVIDWYSRKVLAWRLSNTIDVGFCMQAVQEARSEQEKARQALNDAAHDLLRLQAHGPAQAIQPMHHRWQQAQDQQSEQAAQLQQGKRRARFAAAIVVIQDNGFGHGRFLRCGKEMFGFIVKHGLPLVACGGRDF